MSKLLILFDTCGTKSGTASRICPAICPAITRVRSMAYGVAGRAGRSRSRDVRARTAFRGEIAVPLSRYL